LIKRSDEALVVFRIGKDLKSLSGSPDQAPVVAHSAELTGGGDCPQNVL
jgi:hypothetical protein